MGRDASNIALECALQTRANVCLISEEIEEKKMTMSEVTHYIVDIILKRRELGKDYGMILLPEGLIEFIPEFEVLIAEINDVLAAGADTTIEAVFPLLSPANQVSFNYLPLSIKQQILLERDPHGNVQVAKIETERLLAQTVSKELEALRLAGKYNGKFSPQFHSFGYEGRSGLPSPFDSTYCYALGYNAGAIISQGLSGLMSSVTGLQKAVTEWECGGVPITSMCRMEKRHGKLKPVIKKNLVELDETPFLVFSAQREAWALLDLYRSPGPMQFFCSQTHVELCITLTLELMGSDSRVDASSVKALEALQSSATMNFPDSPSVVVLTKSAAQSAYSEGQNTRLAFKPVLCPSLALGTGKLPVVVKTHTTQCRKAVDMDPIKRAFPKSYGAKLVSLEPAAAAAAAASSRPSSGGSNSPLKVGVLFSGRQAPGGHDVLAALVDALEVRGDGSTLTGFVGGTVGLFKNHSIPLTRESVAMYRGQGGVELLTRTEDTIKAANYGSIINTCQALNLKQLVLIGGSRTVTQAAYLSEYLQAAGVDLQVVCVPVDVSGSLRNEFVETSVGFDTVTKIAGQIVGNNATDGASAKKYYYFIRLMGQEYSHVCLEVALATKPNFAILLEEVEAKSMSLLDITRSIADVIEARAAVGKNYGTILIPDGLIDAIPELQFLISELDSLLIEAVTPGGSPAINMSQTKASLTHWSRTILERLPDFMQAALLLGRGSDGKINVSQIETEKLLAHFVEIELGYRKKRGEYKGAFSAVCSFVGYQARGSLPSNFDVNYAYNLGTAAVALLASGECTGYLATISNLKEPVSSWTAGGVPLCALLECKKPGAEAQIPRARVDLTSTAYQAFAHIVRSSGVTDRYENPGPMQFTGPYTLTDSVPKTLELTKSDYLDDIIALQDTLAGISAACRYASRYYLTPPYLSYSIAYVAPPFIPPFCRPGCDPALLRMTLANLEAVTHTVHQHERQGSF